MTAIIGQFRILQWQACLVLAIYFPNTNNDSCGFVSLPSVPVIIISVGL